MTQKNINKKLYSSKFLERINYEETYQASHSLLHTHQFRSQRNNKFEPIYPKQKIYIQSLQSLTGIIKKNANRNSNIQHSAFKQNCVKQYRPRGQSQIALMVQNSSERKQNQKRLYNFRLFSNQKNLRQTKSTVCQSPKANPMMFESFSKVNEFIKIKKLGTGKFGEVYLVKHTKTGFIAALKIIKKSGLINGSNQQNQKALKQLIRQIKIQSFLSHPNLIKLYDFFNDQQNVYLLLQLAQDGHLYDFLQKDYTFSEETTSIIVRQIVEGVQYMHKHDIIHRDIKLQNIVLCHGMAKICDFGWSVYCPNQFRSTLCGTPLYLSPQVLMGLLYNKKIDSWAIGALTHELITNQNPFKIKKKDELSKIVTEDFQMLIGSPQIRSFITFILRKNPSKRPDSQTILRHPFIQKYKGLETSDQLCHLSSLKFIK